MAKHLIVLVGGLSFLAVVILLGFAIAFQPINWDAGFYLTSGRFVSEGLVPNADFPSPYAPGAYYLFAIVEQLFSASPAAHKFFVYAVHLLNSLVFFSVVRKLGHKTKWAAVFAAFFFAWVFTLDGRAIVLEPFQNFFLLMSLYLILQRQDKAGILAGGLMAGCALMMKQSSMFSVLPLALIAGLPAIILDTGGSLKMDRSGYARLAIFLACLGVPFAVYVAITEQNFFAGLLSLASFGGRGSSYVKQYGLSQIVSIFLNGNGGQILLLFMLGISALLVIIAPTRRNFFFVALGGINLLPLLLVRGYGHYVQLFAPWGTLIVAQFVFALARLAVDSKQELARSLVSAVIFLLLLPPFLSSVREFRRVYYNSPIAHQQQLADKVKKVLRERTDTLVVGEPWLYYLADISPPDRDLGFTNSLRDLEPRLSSAKQVVVAPTPYAKREEIDKLLKDNNFWETHIITLYEKEVRIFEKIS